MKYYQVRFYPNGKFKIVEVEENSFHESQKRDISSCFNVSTKESYHFIVSKECGVSKAKEKIAKHLFKEASKEFTAAKNKLDSITKILKFL